MRHPTARNPVGRLLRAVGLVAVVVTLPVVAGAAPGQDPAPGTTQVASPTSEAPSDPLGCEALVWDPEDVLAGDDTVRAAAEALRADGYDVRVRVEPPTDGDIDARLAQVEEVCPGWIVDGDRPADRVIVMLQPSSRSTGLWYGADVSGALADRWESIQVDDMNPRFRDGDFAGGLAAGLERLAGTRSSSGPSGYTPPDRNPFETPTSDGGGSSRGPGLSLFGPFLFLVLLIAGGWGVSYLSWRSKYDRGEVTESFGEYRSSSGGGHRRSRRFGSVRRSSGGSRRSSGGGRRSSGGGGRRSGGGSTRW